MARILRKILHIVPPTPKEENDDYSDSYSYSFAVEYTGPPISREIPQAMPIDVKQIPIAAKVSSASPLNDVSLTVIQPIVKSRSSDKRPFKKPELGSNRILNSNDVSFELSNELSDLGCVNGDESRQNVSNRIESSNGGEVANGDSCSSKLSDRLQGSDQIGLCNGCDSSDQLSRSLQVVEVCDNSGEDAIESERSSCSVSSELFSGREDDCIQATPRHVKKPSAVTFCDPDSSNVGPEESELSDVESETPARQMAIRPGKKGTCYKCMKGNRFIPKEICIVCGAKYCYNCVVRAMGSMPEGRKCVTCIGQKIDETRRKSLGKSSLMLKQLFPVMEVEKIMCAEKSCKVNQLPPELVYVNSQPLSQQELSLLQRCHFPPKKLKPGYYWYDKVSGFWGKEGHKPCQIISPELHIGGRMRKEASNGNTNVLINNREITKPEFLMLQLIGVKCEGTTHFWVSADGSYQEEGMNNVKGKIWDKHRTKLICIALSLPTPPGSASPSNEEANVVVPQSLDQKSFFKIFLVGCGKSGTSTIFKNAKIIYNVPFSEDERQKIKFMIQSNLYGYLGVLLEGRERFEEESLIKKKRRLSDPCSSSDNGGQIESRTIYSISPKLKRFSDWLLEIMVSGNLETIFPALTSEYGAYVEELWYDAAIQATYSRRDELELLPRVATYFLERAVEVSKKDYEPSDMDILYAEGITSSNGLSSMEFSFTNPPQGSSRNCENNEHDPSHRYQLIRANPKVLGGNCKWLEMFEDVDMVVFCVSLIDYDEYVEDSNGVRTNKMMASKQLFESIVTHPTFEKKKFLLILNKFDLLEEKIEHVPLSRCEWFQDFNPVMGHNPGACSSSARSTNTPLAHRVFQYVAVQFKRLFSSLTGEKLFASLVTALEPDNVDEALRYAREILIWEEEEELIEVSTSIEASTSSHFQDQGSTATN
ncbi:extra-large guanine nucleotide-binding protein 1-like isoform X2 [Euphorbia lathyris]|uniref:extra-large guanine nucleotide-binding protein 1-like isoform X2 n=1 Tax=Euphorbia lathyris TaxID=212925 RepID=UPI003313F626